MITSRGEANTPHGSQPLKDIHRFFTFLIMPDPIETLFEKMDSEELYDEICEFLQWERDVLCLTVPN